MQLPPALAALAHNRPALIGVLGAAGLGGVALIRRRKAAAGNTPTAQTAAAGAAASGDGTAIGAGGVGAGTFPNTYQTDLATALGDLDSKYAGQVATYAAQLGTDEDALSKLSATSAAQAKSLTALNTRVADQNKKIASLTAKKKPAAKKPSAKAPAPLDAHQRHLAHLAHLQKVSAHG